PNGERPSAKEPEEYLRGFSRRDADPRSARIYPALSPVLGDGFAADCCLSASRHSRKSEGALSGGAMGQSRSAGFFLEAQRPPPGAGAIPSRTRPAMPCVIPASRNRL